MGEGEQESALLGGGSALVQAVQAPGHNGVQAGLLHEGVAAHVTLPTPHQIAPLPLPSRLQPLSSAQCNREQYAVIVVQGHGGERGGVPGMGVQHKAHHRGETAHRPRWRMGKSFGGACGGAGDGGVGGEANAEKGKGGGERLSKGKGGGGTGKREARGEKGNSGGGEKGKGKGGERKKEEGKWKKGGATEEMSTVMWCNHNSMTNTSLIANLPASVTTLQHCLHGVSLSSTKSCAVLTPKKWASFNSRTCLSRYEQGDA